MLTGWAKCLKIKMGSGRSSKAKLAILLTLLVFIISIYASTAFTLATGTVSGLSTSYDPIKLGTSVSFYYTLGQTAKVYINVYDSNGSLVRNISNGLLKNAGSWSTIWDGKNSGGILVPDGTYRFTIEAQDPTTGVVVGQGELTRIAARVPVISLVSNAPNPINPLNGQQTTINYNLSCDANVTVSILKGSTPVRTIFSNQLTTAGANSVTWDGKDDSGNIVGDGAYTYQINAVSLTAPSLTAQTKITNGITVEKEAPQITGYGASATLFKIGTSTSLRFTLSENATVYLKVYDSSGNLVKTLLSTAKNSGYNTISWNGSMDPAGTVSEGVYSAKISAVDSFGKFSGEQSVSITVAEQPIFTTAADIVPNPGSPSPGSPETISYTISNNGLVTVQILKGYTVVKTVVNSQWQAAGANTLQWDGTDESGNILGDGTYSCKVTAASPIAPLNYFSTSTKTFSIASAPPELTDISMPLTFKRGSSATIRYNLSESAKVSVDVYNSGGILVNSLYTDILKNAGYNTAVWTGEDSSGNYAGEGTYTVVIRAVDPSNLTGQATGTITFAYQPTFTTAVDVTPNPASPSPATPAFITYSISDSALVTVEIQKNSATIKTITGSQLQDAGVYTFEWDGKDSSGNVAGDAAYTCKVTATSPTVSSYYSISTKTFTVASAPPEVTGLSFSQNPFKLASGNLNISYNLSESAAVCVDVYDGSTLVRNLYVSPVNKNAGYNSTSWDGKDYAGNYVSEGTYTVVITAVDASNLTGQASGTVSAAFQPAANNLTVTPNPYNPSAGSLTFNFELTRNAAVTLTISRYGTPVKTVKSGELMFIGPNTISWDGKNDLGQPVEDGSYTYRLQTASPTASFMTSYSGIFTLESYTAPILSNISVSPIYPRIGGSASFYYTVSEAATVTAQIYQGTQVIRDLSPVTKNGSGSYVFLWDTKDNTGNLVQTGQYTVKLIATDSSNLTGTGELTFTTAGVPVITNVSANPSTIDIFNSGSAGISYSVTEDSFVTVTILAANGSQWRTVAANRSVAPGVVDTVQWDGKGTTGQAIDGIYTFKIDATSAFGSIRAVPATGTVEVVNASKTPQGNSCTDCHQGYPTLHPMTNCNGCHGGDQPISDCAGCHGGGVHSGGLLATYECTYCHNVTYSYKIPIHPANIDELHTSTAIDALCQRCHVNNLTEEHLSNVKSQTDPRTGTLKPWDCYTCHRSNNARVNAAVSDGDVHCTACHQAGHNVNLFRAVPADIPLYSGYRWSTPADAKIFKGESWLPDEFLAGGRVVTSNRRIDVTGDDVWAFYRDEMGADGWTLPAAPVPGANFFNLTFTKGTRKATVWFYGGSERNASPVLTSGYKIEILYK